MRGMAAHLATSALALLALTAAASAGGFQRGVADTDILFERGTFSTRLGYTYVSPERGFTSINGVSGDFGDYTGKYDIPNLAVYFGNDAFGCSGNFTEAFAAEADYTGSPGGALPLQRSSATTTSRTRSIEFNSNEFSTNCRISYESGKSRFSLLGGVYLEDFNFEGSSFGFRNLNPVFAATAPGAGLLALINAGAPGAQITLPTQIDVDNNGDYKVGWRLGAAYEMPEIALRIQGIYRSEVKHDDISGTGTVQITDSAFLTLPNGTTTSIPLVFGPAVAGALTGRGLTTGTVIPVSSSLNEATSPQYFTLSAQTGIAAGTLLLGSFRWTDWSTNNEVVNTISSPLLGTSAAVQPYYWRDGYTASLGIGRAFNEQISGAVSLGYDRGVSTGADTTYTDLYTLSGGLSLKPDKWGEIRFGGLVGYWTDGEQRISDGAYFNADVGEDFVWALNASLKLTF